MSREPLLVSGLFAGLLFASMVCPGRLAAQRVVAPSHVGGAYTAIVPSGMSAGALARGDGAVVPTFEARGAARWPAVDVPDRRGRYLGATSNVQVMALGLAGIVAGVLVGGDGGKAMVVGGAVIGLYGLHRFVRRSGRAAVALRESGRGGRNLSLRRGHS